jgi:hypothetical protein
MGVDIRFQVFEPKLLAFPFKTGRRGVVDVFFEKRE